MGGAIDFALADTFKYNSLGNTDADAVVQRQKIIGGRDYPTKLKLTVDATGGKSSFTARAANKLGSNVTLKFAINEKALEKYNELNGTHYKLLPAKYYSLSAENLTISANNISNGSIDVNVKPLDNELDASTKYAIPVSIASAEGGSY